MQVSLGDFGTNVFPTNDQLTNFISKAQPSLLWLSNFSHPIRACPNVLGSLAYPCMLYNAVLAGLRGEHHP